MSTTTRAKFLRIPPRFSFLSHLQSSSFFPQPSPILPHSASLTLHHSSLTTHPSSCTMFPLSLTNAPLILIPHHSSFTPHPPQKQTVCFCHLDPLNSHHSSLIPHYSSLTIHLSRFILPASKKLQLCFLSIRSSLFEKLHLKQVLQNF